MDKVVRFGMMALVAAGMVAAIWFLPPPQCDLLGHCTAGVAALR